MVKKPIYYLLCLTLLLSFCSMHTALAQEQTTAPRISLSFGDEEEEKPAPATPTTEQPPATATPAPTAGTKIPSAEEQRQMTEEEVLFAIYAWFLVHRAQIDKIELSDGEKVAFLRGVNMALQKKEIPGWEDNMSAVEELMNERWAPVFDQIQRERKQMTIDLFADLAKQENVKRASSGLFYELVSEGTGKFPTEDSTISVEFVAQLVDGTVFESSESSGGPVKIQLANMVPGVREGLQYVREGGIIKLWVPASLGFGSQTTQTIPADSALLFEFTLHEILESEEAQN